MVENLNARLHVSLFIYNKELVACSFEEGEPLINWFIIVSLCFSTPYLPHDLIAQSLVNNGDIMLLVTTSHAVF